MSWVNSMIYTVKNVGLRVMRFVFLLAQYTILFVACFYLISSSASAESLPYEVFHFTNSWWYQPIGNFLYLTGKMDSKEGIWKSDGSKSGTVQITDNIFSREMTIAFHNEKIGDLIFFVADQNNNGLNELYIANEADGTNLLVEEFNEPLLSGNISTLKVYKDNFFFNAHTNDEGWEMWRTEGVPHSAVLVKDICPGSCDAEIAEVVEFGGNLFFGADDNSNGRELWVSDGTGAGTLLLANIYSVPLAPGDYSTSSSPQDFVILGDKLLFTANDGVHGREFWSTDSVVIDSGGVTSSNVMLVKDCTPGVDAATGDPYDSSPKNLVLYKDKVYFIVHRQDLDDDSGWTWNWQIWETDGSEAGTVPVGPVYNSDNNGSDPGRDGMIAMDDKLFVSMRSKIYGHELFYVDLLSDDKSLHLLKDIYPGSDDYENPAASSPYGLAVVSGSTLGKKDLFYFNADSPGYGRELWVSDGTAAGTYLLRDLTPGPDSSVIDEVNVIGSQLFFRFNYWYLWAIDRNYEGYPSGNFSWSMFLPAITGRVR